VGASGRALSAASHCPPRVAKLKDDETVTQFRHDDGFTNRLAQGKKAEDVALDALRLELKVAGAHLHDGDGLREERDETIRAMWLACHT